MSKDPNGDCDNRYHIRSLYFDDIHNNAYYEKLNGIKKRKKYRIRIYNHSNSVIKVERKGKEGQYTQKESELISEDLCNGLISGNTNLLLTGSPLLSDMYIQMKTLFLKPVVLVDYIREAYIHPVENVRITFDMELKSGLYSTELWNTRTPLLSVLEPNLIIMEVKFNKFLPSIFTTLLSGLNSEQISISKYILCRKFAERCVRGEWNEK
ncbi:MAG: polyphosphate polymerase domain-containing protein [Clostridiaceae bacterium]|nr:polyphosphate polymerase domain-containing protein [Clostridiaceae bacterium]